MRASVTRLPPAIAPPPPPPCLETLTPPTFAPASLQHPHSPHSLFPMPPVNFCAT